ncbi:MAG: 2OG-Fe(II) oxygenase [Nitrospirales bacterium]|nr:2OG-Fe(II) oxygenase [Nitrospirales bacterium]
MSQHTTIDIDQQLTDLLSTLGREEWKRRYWEQGEFLVQDQVIPSPIIDSLMKDVETVRPKINRNFIPGHKKGGSVSFYLVQQYAPSILALYYHQGWIDFLSGIAGVPLLLCPESDPHACALYFYTEAGDHIGYHYDTSYYKGDRFTVLVGLRDRSTSKLMCRLHTKEPGRPQEELALATDPGTYVFFNGDKLYHAVTPLGANEERIVLTLQYVTNPAMGLAQRWFSNMKDAVGYFGWSALLGKPSA